jgi:hypothetical protein
LPRGVCVAAHRCSIFEIDKFSENTFCSGYVASDPIQLADAGTMMWIPMIILICLFCFLRAGGKHVCHRIDSCVDGPKFHLSELYKRDVLNTMLPGFGRDWMGLLLELCAAPSA